MSILYLHYITHHHSSVNVSSWRFIGVPQYVYSYDRSISGIDHVKLLQKTQRKYMQMFNYATSLSLPLPTYNNLTFCNVLDTINGTTFDHIQAYRFKSFDFNLQPAAEVASQHSNSGSDSSISRVSSADIDGDVNDHNKVQQQCIALIMNQLNAITTAATATGTARARGGGGSEQGYSDKASSVAAELYECTKYFLPYYKSDTVVNYLGGHVRTSENNALTTTIEGNNTYLPTQITRGKLPNYHYFNTLHFQGIDKKYIHKLCIQLVSKSYLYLELFQTQQIHIMHSDVSSSNHNYCTTTTTANNNKHCMKQRARRVADEIIAILAPSVSTSQFHTFMLKRIASGDVRNHCRHYVSKTINRVGGSGGVLYDNWLGIDEALW